jgi:hypothetical protein
MRSSQENIDFPYGVSMIEISDTEPTSLHLSVGQNSFGGGLSECYSFLAFTVFICSFLLFLILLAVVP